MKYKVGLLLFLKCIFVPFFPPQNCETLKMTNCKMGHLSKTLSGCFFIVKFCLANDNLFSTISSLSHYHNKTVTFRAKEIHLLTHRQLVSDSLIFIKDRRRNDLLLAPHISQMRSACAFHYSTWITSGKENVLLH